jgi:hypothetical protein
VVDRKGIRFPNQAVPSGPGKPPAEGAVTFSTNLSGWVGSMLCSLLFFGFFSVIPIQLTKEVVENGSDVGPFPPSQYTSAPSAISAGYLPIRTR